jgi:hypothetical protein
VFQAEDGWWLHLPTEQAIQELITSNIMAIAILIIIVLMFFVVHSLFKHGNGIDDWMDDDEPKRDDYDED